jgi:quinol monooxygenase YgiN
VSDYTILVTFELEPGASGAFLELVTANARLSLDTEAGCRVFDVLLPAEGSDRVVLYERYDSRASFESHLRTAHFLSFDEAAAPLVRAKHFTEYRSA